LKEELKGKLNEKKGEKGGRGKKREVPGGNRSMFATQPSRRGGQE